MGDIEETNFRKFPIAGADASAKRVMERLGGTLPARCPLATSVGIESLSGISGFEAEGFSYRHKLQDVWALVGILCGEGVVECGGKSVNAKPGTIYIIPPGAPFQETNSGECAWGFACLLLRCGDSLISQSISRSSVTCLMGGFEMVGKVAEAVKALHCRPPGFEMKAVGGTLLILGCVRERLELATMTEISNPVEKAVGVMRQNLGKPPDMERLAKLCGVSVSLLSHKFKKEMGMSPMMYARKERVRAAKEVILAGASVDEAASRLGFKSPFHLSRIFTEIEGKPPIYFKKLSRRSFN